MRCSACKMEYPWVDGLGQTYCCKAKLEDPRFTVDNVIKMLEVLGRYSGCGCCGVINADEALTEILHLLGHKLQVTDQQVCVKPGTREERPQYERRVTVNATT